MSTGDTSAPPKSSTPSPSSSPGTPTSHEHKKHGGLVTFILIVIVIFFVRQPIGEGINDMVRSFDSSASSESLSSLSSSDDSEDMDDSANSDDSSDSAESSDTSDIKDENKRILGATYDGTTNPSSIKEYKISLSSCSHITNDEKKPAIRCLMTWTNPYSTALTDTDQERPMVNYIGDPGTKDGSIKDTWPADNSRYSKEILNNYTAQPHATVKEPIYFTPGSNSTVWVSYDRFYGDNYVTTTFAKIDMKTLTVTNAK
ncbi:MAG: hypothetical protein LKJ47_03480 [Bifidobacteriaceae bacterium]|jgi:hypothetical protein|nr:hypothetical protein [Bifidobacteriaceae bacterium]